MAAGGSGKFLGAVLVVVLLLVEVFAAVLDWLLGGVFSVAVASLFAGVFFVAAGADGRRPRTSRAVR
jgi:hypothetical protein